MAPDDAAPVFMRVQLQVNEERRPLTIAAHRILHERTEKSQALGAMIWGVGTALHEDAVIDKRDGHFVNQDLGEHHVPAHADSPPSKFTF